jgi:hypothetical protein
MRCDWLTVVEDSTEDPGRGRFKQGRQDALEVFNLKKVGKAAMDIPSR